MTGLGASVKDVLVESFEEFTLRSSSNERAILGLDFKLNLQQYLSLLTKNPNNVNTLQDLETYTRADPKEMYKTRDTNTWKASLALNYSITDAKGYNMVQDQKYLANQVIDVTLHKNNIDVLVLPSSGIFASHAAAIDGHPIITVPLGYYPQGTLFVLMTLLASPYFASGRYFT
jgi:amidase